MPDLLAATYALRPRNELARSALPGAPVAPVKRRWTRTLRLLPFARVRVRRTVASVSRSTSSVN
ncbi:hypothetical protein [Nonomuraea sp. NPDC049400]|uniref:hypothetical protein n=1 Tax=Nonomuraea sp. NPDC049400 TaxID=3364352 RepID=UPI0037A5582B